MHYSIAAVLYAVALATLAGCGQMGPLYLPPEETQQSKSAEPSDNSQQPAEEPLGGTNL
jgi:predicted small lipoprotein YifL